jgi:tetratricopeptide (TPR) repeat protein
MKVGIYYMKHKKYKKAIEYFNKVQNYQKEKSYNIALCLVELGKYDKAYEIMKSLKKYDDKKIQNLYKGLYEYFKDLTIVYPIYNPSKENKQKQTKNNSNSKTLLKKDNPW